MELATMDKHILEALRKDAERYRHIKPFFRVFSLHIDGQHSYAVSAPFARLRGPNIDAAIDASIEAAMQEKETQAEINKALTALEAVVAHWAKETNVRRFAENLAAIPVKKRADAIEGVIETFMMEAAYRTCTDDTRGNNLVLTEQSK